jgi:hypothetical protein
MNKGYSKPSKADRLTVWLKFQIQKWAIGVLLTERCNRKDLAHAKSGSGFL